MALGSGLRIVANTGVASKNLRMCDNHFPHIRLFGIPFGLASRVSKVGSGIR